VQKVRISAGAWPSWNRTPSRKKTSPPKWKKLAGTGAVISIIGAVGAVQFRLEADKYRAEAARLPDELAQMDNDLTARLPNP
jgi:hypothetical protein